MLSTTFDLFLLISAIHGFIFSSFVIKNYKSKDNGILYITLLVLTIALNNLQSWLLTKDFILLNYIQIPWHFLLAPLFYTFILHYLNLKNKYFNFLKVFVPFFLVSILIQVVYLELARQSVPLHDYKWLYEKYTSFEEAISYITSLVLFGYCLHIIKVYKRRNSKNQVFDNLRWISNFIIFAELTYVIWGVSLFSKFYLNFENFIVFYYPLRVMTTVIIYWLGYELLISLRKVKERKIIRKNRPEIENKPRIDSDTKYKKISSYITENHKYLDCELSIESLAEEFQISSSQLSKVINEHTGNNFKYLINSHRIQFSKELLLDPSYSNFTIASIALESGFNSKSAFYNSFRKHTGMTPSEFRQKNEFELHV